MYQSSLIEYRTVSQSMADKLTDTIVKWTVSVKCGQGRKQAMQYWRDSFRTFKSNNKIPQE